MRLVNAVLALLFLAQSSGYAGSPTFKPTINVVHPNYQYSRTVESLHAIAFRNLKVFIFWERGTQLTARLQNGGYSTPLTDTSPSESVSLEWVRFVGNNPEYAVIFLRWVTIAGSSSTSGIVQVFALQDKHPVVVQQMEFNMRGCQAAGATFDRRRNILTIKGLHGWEHCCPTTLDIVTYAWDGSSFRQQSATSAPMAGQC